MATIVLMVFAQNAMADKIKVTGDGGYRAGLGGEFTITAADAGGKALLIGNLSSLYTNGVNGTRIGIGIDGLLGFQTFCIEYNEHISLNSQYEAAISDGSILGGAGGGVDPDGAGPLPKSDKVSMGTAYLYTLFATGALGGYDYNHGGGRAASAVALQHAFWYLEDELAIPAAALTGNIFLKKAIDDLGGLTAAKANNDFSLYKVKALNLGSPTPSAQDQLIMVSVPDGGLTAMMLGLGLAGLGTLRRKLL